MNENGASVALRAAAAGDQSKLDELCTWLSMHDSVAGRYLAPDLLTPATAAAVTHGDGGLSQLLKDLQDRPDSMLAAFFPGEAAPGVIELPSAFIGRAGELKERAPNDKARRAWPDDENTLAVLSVHPAQGRLGAIRTAAWLQTVLGAIGLARYAHSGAIAPLASCPALGTAFYLSTESGNPDHVDRAALLAPGPPPAPELAEILTTPASWDILLDAASPKPNDLAQQRLTQAARWLQVASSAISAADSLVALGIALETIAGDGTKGAVVDRITRRAAIFRAVTADDDEQEDVFYEELKRAKKLYDLRSRAAHGQYDELSQDQSVQDDGREEFHRFVLDVTLGFRRLARDRNMQTLDDFNNWWKRTELRGWMA